MDLIESGELPNPAELLLNPRLSDLFSEIRKQYDYISRHSSCKLSNRHLIINEHVDMFVYVARSNFLDKHLLAVPDNLYTEKRLNNMAILINGINHKEIRLRLWVRLWIRLENMVPVKRIRKNGVLNT